MISVIMPAYNAEEKINITLESVKQQSYKDFELIIINDGSTDNTENICRKFIDENKDINCRLINIENGGVSNARNIGIGNANGNFLVFVDADDTLEKDMLKILIENIENFDYIIANYATITNNFKTVENYKNEMISEKNFCELYMLQAFNPLWNKIFKKSIIEKNNIRFDKNVKVGEDLLFISEYIYNCKNDGKVISDVVYNYYKCNSNSNFAVRYDAAQNCVKINDIVVPRFVKRFNLSKLDEEKMNYLCVLSVARRYKLWLKEKNKIKTIVLIHKDYIKLNLSKYRLETSKNIYLKRIGNIIKKKTIIGLFIYIVLFGKKVDF